MTKQAMSSTAAALLTRLRAIDTSDMPHCFEQMTAVLMKVFAASGEIANCELRAINKETNRLLRETKARVCAMAGAAK